MFKGSTTPARLRSVLILSFALLTAPSLWAGPCDTMEADFSSSAPACTGEGVDFVNTGSSDAAYDYSWDFGSGANPATSTNENPSGVTYSSAGTKTVTFTITDPSEGCVKTETKGITIHQEPTTGFTSNAPVCEGSAVNFNNTGSSGSQWTYSWDFGSGASPNTSSAENPSGITYSSSGTKTVTQTITDDNGHCSATLTQTIGIQATPSASFSTNAAGGCTGDAFSFSNTGSSGGSYSYTWDLGAGASPATSSMENPSGVTYSSSGNKEVMFVIENTSTGCTDTAWTSFTIHETPTVSFTANTPRCAGEDVDFTNNGSSGSQWSYSWDFGPGSDPNTSTAENPSGIVYSSGGMRPVTLTVSSSHCQNSDSMQIAIDSVPQADAGDDTTICADRSAQLGTPADPGHAYSWFPSNTLDDPTLAQPTASPEAQVTQYLLTETDTMTGCSAQDSVTVTMVTTAFADAGPDVEICEGDSVQIGSGHIEGQAYRWAPSDSLTDDTVSNPFAFPDTSTVYTMKTSYEGCDTITDDVMVTVHPLPDVRVQDVNGKVDSTEITKGSSIQLVASGAVQYEWMPAWGLNNPGVHDPVASPGMDTLYKVKGTDMHGCVNHDSIHVHVIEPDVWAPNAFTPDGDGKNDRFFIRAQGVEEFELSIFDRSGRLIYHSNDHREGWDGTVQGSGEKLPEGAYVYRANGELSDGTSFDEKGMINLLR